MVFVSVRCIDEMVGGVRCSLDVSPLLVLAWLWRCVRREQGKMSEWVVPWECFALAAGPNRRDQSSTSGSWPGKWWFSQEEEGGGVYGCPVVRAWFRGHYVAGSWKDTARAIMCLVIFSFSSCEMLSSRGMAYSGGTPER